MQVYKTVRVRFNRTVGGLWHFGHFMHDFLMPMSDYLETLRPDPSYKIEVILFVRCKPRPLKIMDDFLGDFTDIAERLLNIKVRYEHQHFFNTLYDVKLHDIQCYGFGPYFPQTFDKLLTRAEQAYGLSICKEHPPVILIERGYKFISANSLGLKSSRSGGALRCIKNHNQLKDALRSKYGDAFINVVLEYMPFEEQIALFKSARLVIAQHGAGLCNIAWMTNPRATVFELPPIKVYTFLNMCIAKGISYRTTATGLFKNPPMRTKTFIDVTQIMSMLSDIDVGAVRT